MVSNAGIGEPRSPTKSHLPASMTRSIQAVVTSTIIGFHSAERAGVKKGAKTRRTLVVLGGSCSVKPNSKG